MAPGLECFEGNGTKGTAAGPSFILFFFFSCLLTRKEGQIFQAFWGFWSLAQGPRSKSKSTASDLPSFPFFPMVSFSSQQGLCFLALLMGQKPSMWSLGSLCSTRLTPGLWLQIEEGSSGKEHGQERPRRRKASWVWWFHSQATSLKQNLTFTTVSYWFCNLPLIWWQLLGRGYGLGEILSNCRQFYCTHQK